MTHLKFGFDKLSTQYILKNFYDSKTMTPSQSTLKDEKKLITR